MDGKEDIFKPLEDRETGWVWARRLVEGIEAAFGLPLQFAARAFSRKVRDEFKDALLPLEILVRQLLFLEAALLPKPKIRPKPARTEKPKAEPPKAEPENRWGLSPALLEEAERIKASLSPAVLEAVARMKERQRRGIPEEKMPRIRVLGGDWTPRPPPPEPEPEPKAKRPRGFQMIPGPPAPGRRTDSDAPLAFDDSVRRPGAGGPSSSPRDRRDFFDATPLAARFAALMRVLENPAPYARRLARRLHANTELAYAFTDPLPKLNQMAPGTGLVLDGLRLVRAEAIRVFGIVPPGLKPKEPRREPVWGFDRDQAGEDKPAKSEPIDDTS